MRVFSYSANSNENGYRNFQEAVNWWLQKIETGAEGAPPKFQPIFSHFFSGKIRNFSFIFRIFQNFSFNFRSFQNVKSSCCY